MTYPTYSHQHLQRKSIACLKEIYSEIGCTTTVRDRRCKDSWINEIITHQSTHVQKVDEQAIAQEELENYIADQGDAVAPEELTTVEINSQHYQVYAGTRLIAYISYDNSEFVTQRWVVMVNGVEIFRHTTLAQCQRYIEWHHKDGTFNLPIVGKEQWCYIQASSKHQEKVPCNFATDAPDLLQIDNTPMSCEELLDLPFEQLTTVQWEQLREYQPEYRELVAA
jgi:hypothetical protein